MILYKKTLLLFLLMVSFSLSGQKENTSKMGQATLEELKMSVYELDSTANAVVLYEQSNFYPNNKSKTKFATDNYYRIKVLTSDGLEKGTYSFGLYKKDKLLEVQAITYNLGKNDSIITLPLEEKDIIINQVNDDFQEVILTLPKVKIGSVIEIRHSVVSSNPNIDTWYFQSDIPKLKSEIQVLTPNFIDHVRLLKGPLELSGKTFINDKKCFSSIKKKKLCNYSSFRMDSIPKFEEELLMPDPISFISRLKFKLSKFNRKGYIPYRMMRFWFQFDDAYRSYLLANKKAKTSFFRNKIPDSIKTGKNKLEIAKNIYSFVQNHYTWNGYKGGDSKYKFRRKSKKKSASLDLINVSLYNSLKELGIDVYYVLVGTRGSGIPERTIPEFESFNYTIIKAVINEKEYFLDAANKKLGFGSLSPLLFNGEARVLDFKKGSYWQKLKPRNISVKTSITTVSFDDEMNLEGKMLIKRNGIEAYIARELYKELGEEKYLETIEEDIRSIDIDNFEMKYIDDLNHSLSESQDIFLDSEDVNTLVDSDEIIRFSPVFFDQLSVNPFKNDERIFDLDFIYERKNNYRISIEIPNHYIVSKLPENLGLSLPNDGGTYIYKVSQSGNKINLFIKFHIQKDLFSTEEYFYLKEFYNKIIQTEASYIELKKQ